MDAAMNSKMQMIIGYILQSFPDDLLNKFSWRCWFFKGNFYCSQNSQYIEKTKTIEKYKLCKNQGNMKSEKQVGMQLSLEIRLGHQGKIQRNIAQEGRDIFRGAKTQEE